MKHATKLTDLQLELLKLFSMDISDQKLKDIKRILGDYFSQRLFSETERIWNEKKLKDSDMDEWLKELS